MIRCSQEYNKKEKITRSAIRNMNYYKTNETNESTTYTLWLKNKLI